MTKLHKLFIIILIVSFILSNTFVLEVSAASATAGTQGNGAAVLAQGNSFHNLALQSDGTVWAWGDNSRGQLGDGTTTDRTVPVQVRDSKDPTGYLQNVTAITEGMNFSLALKSDGTVWTWGGYKLGADKYAITSPTQIKAPKDPTGYLSQIVAITSEGGHALALKKDGTLWGFGDDYKGTLGDFRTYDMEAQDAYMVPYLNGVTAVSTAGDFTMILKQDGSVWGCGDLKGNGDLSNTASNFRQIRDAEDNSGYLTNVVKMFGSGNTVAFVKNDGTVKLITNNDSIAWTSLSEDEKTTSRKLNFFPAPNGFLDDAVSMSFSGGTKESIVCRKDGSVWVWTEQTVEGDTINPTDLKQVSGIQNAVEVKAEGGHFLVLTKDGTIYSWGSNYSGELGDGTKTNRDTPVKVKDFKISFSSSTSSDQMILKLNDTNVKFTGELSGTPSDDTLILPMQYGIAVNKTWKVTSNVALNKATVNSNSIAIVDVTGNVVKSSISLTDNGMAILVKTTANYTPSRIYYLALTGVKSVKGHQLLKTVLVPFTIKPATSIDSSMGNSNGNILNGGYAVLDSGWIYYRGADSKLYKMTEGGKNRTKLSDDDPVYINSSGNYIYYKNMKDKNLYRINKNGSGRTLLYRGITERLNVVGNTLYFIKTDSDKTGMGPVYKMDTNGKGLKQAVPGESNVYALYVQGSSLYYTSSKYNASARGIIIDTYSTPINSYSPKLVCTNAAYVDVAGDWVYTVQGVNQTLFKSSRNGMVTADLSNSKTGTINVAGDWIYYVNKDDQGKLYKMSLDGSKVYWLDIIASDYPVNSINLAGGWIFINRRMYSENDFVHTLVSKNAPQSIVQNDDTVPEPTPAPTPTPVPQQNKSELIAQYNDSGNEHMKNKEYDLALEDLNKALAFDSSNPLLYHNIGVVYAMKGEFDNSMNNMKKAIELKPDYAQAYYDCAFIQDAFKHSTEALQSYKMFLQYADKSDPQIQQANDRIQALSQLGDTTGLQSPTTSSSVKSMVDFNPRGTLFIPTKDSSRTYGGKVALVRTNFDAVYTSSDRDTIFAIDSQYTTLNLSVIFDSTEEDSIDITFYDADNNMELKKLTLNKGEMNKDISMDVSGVKQLGVRVGNIQNEATKNGYSVYHMGGYPKNTLTLIDPVLSK